MKKILTLVVLLLAVAGIASIAVWTEGFTAWEITEVNESNLINVSLYDGTLDNRRTDGLTVDVDEDGKITVEGKNDGETDIKIKVGEVKLAEGEYTFSAARSTSKKTYYMSLENGDTVIYNNDGKNSTFDVETETTYSIYIVVNAGQEIDTTFKPVLVAGDEAGSFYVMG